jgi:hypothetical protein
MMTAKRALLGAVALSFFKWSSKIFLAQGALRLIEGRRALFIHLADARWRGCRDASGRGTPRPKPLLRLSISNCRVRSERRMRMFYGGGASSVLGTGG